MTRRTEFILYEPKTILNKGKRADHWFWTRHSAYPYTGCQHGCGFCYCREQKYSPYDDPDDFAYRIRVKANAPELLRKALRHAPLDVIFTGDYQPAERKFRISRQMLQVCSEMGFPVFVLSRSPLVLRDLDVFQSIQNATRATVAFSIITTPDSREYERVCQIENLAPPAAKRFQVMEKLAAAGIPTGTCLMPVLPGLCDTDENLRNVARWTADHGGQFVLAGGLTLSDQQRAYFFNLLAERFPDLLPLYQRSYPAGSYGPAGKTWQRTAQQVREYCHLYGIPDRIPRPIWSGEQRVTSKRVVEALANRLYSLELEGAPSSKQWEYRKAAWAVEDLEQDVALVYRSLGLKGLQSIPEVSEGMALEIERLLGQLQPGLSAPG